MGFPCQQIQLLTTVFLLHPNAQDMVEASAKQKLKKDFHLVDLVLVLFRSLFQQKTAFCIFLEIEML